MYTTFTCDNSKEFSMQRQDWSSARRSTTRHQTTWLLQLSTPVSRSKVKLGAHGAQRPVSSTSAVNSKVKGQGRKVMMWSVWQLLAYTSRTKSPRNTKIGRKVAHPTGNNTHQVRGQKGQRSKSPGRLILKPKVCRLRTSNMVDCWVRACAINCHDQL